MLNSYCFREVSTCELSSYKIKELIENDSNIGHITNGQLIVLLCSLGFSCKKDGSSRNPLFNLRHTVARKLCF